MSFMVAGMRCRFTPLRDLVEFREIGDPEKWMLIVFRRLLHKVAITFLFAATLLVIPISAQSSSHAKGLEPLSKEEYLRIPLAPQPVSGKLPDSATLESFFPEARSQGLLLSCTAWAASYNKAYRIFMASGQRGDPEDYVQSPAFLYSALTGEKCNKGTPIPLALDFLRVVGSLPWSDLPYTDTSCPQWRIYRSNAKNNSFGSTRLTDDPTKLISQIRNHIVNGDPLIAAINACDEFDHPLHGRITDMSGSEASCDPHAVLIVGYDDLRQAVRVINSWGSGWGEQGKVWMSYSVLRSRILEAYVDEGPGQGSDELAIWDQTVTQTPAAAYHSPVVTPEILRASLRSNIDPKILGHYAPIDGEPVNISIWSIWLSLPKIYSSQIESVRYYFHHHTFRPEGIPAITGSSVFLAQWRGYGCTEDAHVIAKLRDKTEVRADFNFCTVADSQTEAQVPKRPK
jgi:hypothetical protein